MRDPGLQAERTALAWQRTGVSGAAVAGAAALAAAHLGVVRVLVTVTVMSVLCALAVEVAARSAQVAAGGDGRRTSPWIRLVAMAAIPVLLAVAGVLLAWGAPPPSP